LGHDVPADHPLSAHLIAAAAKVKAATDGKGDIQVFPNNQLGNGNHMLAQLRSGAMHLVAVGDTSSRKSFRRLRFFDLTAFGV
jgi:TRAP-type C4-dicarboxylate transport system substrate-binding protein